MKTTANDSISVIRTEKLPSTVNAWGSSGSVHKVKHFLSNGDVVVTGLAVHRHIKSENWANLLPCAYNVDGAGEDWNGGWARKGVITLPSLNSYLKKINK